MLNDSIHYDDGSLCCDAIPVSQIAEQTGTPVYVYSLKRVVNNLHSIQGAFHELGAHIHYSAKANANLTVLRTIIQAGAGIDAVSAGEIHKALTAGAKPADIVFAGVGKTPDELRYGVEQGVGWFNIENVVECGLLDVLGREFGRQVRVALRLNPEVTANTHPYIATGHGGAKFGLTAEVIRDVLARQSDYPNLSFEGIHVHIGSQLHDTEATQRAVRAALDLIAPYPTMRTVNIGGGLPVAYRSDETLPSWKVFADTLKPLLKGYSVLLEPGRSIIADAGVLVVQVLYVKRQAGQMFLITDGSMAELIRPALYQAHHEIVAVKPSHPHPQPLPIHGEGEKIPSPLTPLPHGEGNNPSVNVVGPVCETTDVLGRQVHLPEVQAGDLLAILTTGAYGMVMASNYNARLRPAEVVVSEDGQRWQVARQRETWDELVRNEMV